MLLPLPMLQYIGEESVFALKSYEMFLSGNYLQTSLYGGIMKDPPFYHWLVIGIVQVIGWDYLEVAIRLVSVLASWLSALMLGVFAAHLWRDRQVGWLAAAVYLCLAEVMFWYGWLGYVDMSFACCLLAANLALWRAVEARDSRWYFVACLLLAGSVMVKNLTAYPLFAATALVLVWRMQAWHFLYKPLVILGSLLALCLPVVWGHAVNSGGEAVQTQVMWAEIMRKFSGVDLLAYAQHLIEMPLQLFLRCAPFSLLLLFLWWQAKQRWAWDAHLSTLAWIALLSFMPFWLAPGGSPRYFLPVYPWLALIITYLLWQLQAKHLKLAVQCMVIVLVLKVPYSLWGLPYLKDGMIERDLKVVAQDIIEKTEGWPICSVNVASTGLSVAAYINVMRDNGDYIRYCTGSRAFMISYHLQDKLGSPEHSYRIRGDALYLYRIEGDQH
ncbi:MAG: glycosyltransferase family 39 protein [Mariprofundaceae bacterium]|nr:glycosyltransferase family 39 protein [Mariprofundaceae bacterium]